MSAPSLVFCVDIGGTRCKYGLVALENGELVAQLTRPTVTRGLDALVTELADAVEALCVQASIARARIVGAGIGIPGYVAGDTISLVWASLAFMEGQSFRPALEARLGLPVRMDNDARVAALGEAYFGVSEVAHRLLCLTLGTGIGFGFVVDGRLQESTSINHMAGHIRVRPGPRCYCGLDGCLESLVSGPALVAAFDALGGQGHVSEQPDPVRAILEAAASGRARAARAVEQMLDDLAVGLNVYINLFAPDTIVLGGGLAQGLMPFLPALRRALVACPYSGYTVRLYLSTLGEKAGLYGAASLWKAGLSESI